MVAAKFILKPLMWNTENYKRPSGAKTASRWVDKHGFGAEEWNNSPHMVSKDGKERYFHTEAGDKIIAHHRELNGQFVIFMVASHDGRQELVGIAGNAAFVTDDNERAKIALDIKSDKLGDDAWDVQKVRDIYKTHEAFEEFWLDSSPKSEGVNAMTLWRCPADYFLWLDQPVPLDAKKITGKDKLAVMHSNFQILSSKEAERILDAVAPGRRLPPWGNIFNLVSQSVGRDRGLLDDMSEIDNQAIPETTKRALIDARIGQGKFRENLEKHWSAACSVTGCEIGEVLRASHIRPWRCSSNEERLDPENGLLLMATLDAAFDRGLISFSEQGEMLVASRLSEEQRVQLGVPRPLRKPPSKHQAAYLRFHREYWRHF